MRQWLVGEESYKVGPKHQLAKYGPRNSSYLFYFRPFIGAPELHL